MTQDTRNLRRPLRHLAALLATLLAVIALAWFLRQGKRPDILVLYVQRLTALLVPALILAGALGIGLRLLRVLRVNGSEPAERLVLAVALGLGILSALVLLLGAMGLLLPALWIVLLIAGAAVSAGDAYRLAVGLGRSAAASLRRPNFVTLLWVIMALFFLLNLTPAFVPAWEYDTQEYHLGVPARFYRAGRISFLRDNVYGGFPQNVENMYLLSMVLRGSTRGGAESGIVLNAVLGLLTAIALRQFGKRLFRDERENSRGAPASATAGDYAAAIFYLWPAVTIYGSSGYVEAGLIFYSVAAMLALSHVLRRSPDAPEGRRSDIAWGTLCGLMTGCAMGVKYPAALFLFVPIGLALFGDFIVRGPRGRALAILLAWLLAVGVAWSPWVVRNVLWTGNPSYPLLYSVFGGSNWDAAKDAKWTQAHAPHAATGSDFGSKMHEIFFSWQLASVLLILFIPFVVLGGRRHARAALLLAAYGALYVLLWFFFTHRIERFIAPLMPLLAVLSGAGVWCIQGILPRAVQVVFVLLLLFEPSRLVCYLNFAESVGTGRGIMSEEQFFADPNRTDFREGYLAMKFINDNLPDDAKVLFIGEARTFYCEKRFSAPTVFDDQPIEQAVAGAKSPDDVYRALKKQGFTHVLINADELIRLQDPTKAYGHVYQGKRHLGLMDGFDWELFDAFANKHLKRLCLFGGEQTHPWPAYDWYRWQELRQEGQRPSTFIALYELVP